MSKYTSGLDEVLRNLNKEIASLDRKTATGVKKAGLLVLRESNKRVPVDFGFLKASGFLKMMGKGSKKQPIAHVGYTAEYALYVHENMEARHGPDRLPFRRRGKTIGPGGPGQEAKFLENAVKSNILKIVQFIKLG